MAFTLILLAPSLAQAAHPSQKLVSEGTTVKAGEFVAYAPSTSGLVLARQVVEPQARPANASAKQTQRAQSRIVYMNHMGTVLWPGGNDASLQQSSIVQEPVELTSWDIDDDTWAQTMSCMTDMYKRWDIVITDQDPGNVPHIEAVFGGHPNDVGLPDNVAGVSPFTTDCSNIENSVVFTFTDVLPDNPQLMCEIMAQEIAHSYGLDHEMLAQDPMSYLDYEDNRTFQDQDATCGEFDGRPCGINGNVCRATQNSVEQLNERLGKAGGDDDTTDHNTHTDTTDDGMGGCSATNSSSGAGSFALVLGLLAMRRRRARVSN